jgi:hypothetical protein
MANAGTRRIELNSMLPRERFNRRVLLQVVVRSVLDVVIEGEDGLARRSI